ncbi:MAG: hypothetical protein WB630_02690 [Candidatus Acidiferrales bacterium]
MGNRQLRLRTAPTLLLGVATLLWFPSPAHAQSTTTQARDSRAVQSDDITRRDLARFDQFLDAHRGIADELRRTPSLIDDPEYLQNHPELNAYLQEHPSVKQEISQRPDEFMRLEDRYDRDRGERDRDAGGSDRDADRDRDAYHRDLADFGRFLDGHREIAEQVRKDPSLLDNREFVQSHPALQEFLQNNPGVRDQLRRDPNAFMRQEDAYQRDANAFDRDADRRDRDADRRELADFDRFLERHREIAEQVRRDPSLLDKREFVQNHPALQNFLQENPGVRDELRQDPNAFMRQEDRFDRSENGDRTADHRMADFGGFLGEHSDIQKDLSRNPSVVKNHEYVQNHAELSAYLNAHPDVRDQLMANPQSFVKGAEHFSNGSTTGTTGGAGVNGSGNGAGTTAGSSAGSATNPEPQQNPKPKQ